MHTILKGMDREHLFESLPYMGFIFAMAVIGSIFMVVAILGLLTTP
ncbi:MAG: hypothetical protein OEZ04_13210 [Nitrospinota bacterium]|nr:hypothetical protein [Nitrospinota bacterium]